MKNELNEMVLDLVKKGCRFEYSKGSTCEYIFIEQAGIKFTYRYENKKLIDSY